jgi:hypothetical protein
LKVGFSNGRTPGLDVRETPAAHRCFLKECPNLEIYARPNIRH